MNAMVVFIKTYINSYTAKKKIMEIFESKLNHIHT